MLNSRRYQYLQAMGITAWQQRQTGRTDTEHHQPEPLHDQHHTQQPDTVIDRPSTWLVWLENEDAQQQWPAIVKDLQAICASAKPDSTSITVISRQPDELPPATGVLAIGLSDASLNWLKVTGNQVAELPDLARWHDDPSLKQQLWQMLQERMW